MIFQILCLFFTVNSLHASPALLSDNTAALNNHEIWTISSPSPLTQSIDVALGSLHEEGKIDILLFTSSSLQFRVFPDSKDEVRRNLEDNGAIIEVQVKNVGEYLRELERKSPSRSHANPRVASELPTDSYMSYDQIETYLDAIAADNPSIVTKTSIGKTIENRDIWMITIKPSSGETKNSIFVEGGIHAREWISPAVTLYLIDTLIKEPCMVEGIEFRIVPVANPDGYVFSHVSDRFWRKNRRDNSGSSCAGVDLNRNWDYKYGDSGTSSNPCSEIYKGTGPFSEPETNAVSNAMKNTPNLKLMLAIHSYGQLMLYPWGYTSSDAPTKDLLKEVADEFVTRVKTVNSYTYTTMSAGQLYPASGATDDWAYGALGVKYSYTLELRDTGANGFELPASQIDPTRKEIWEGFKYLIEKVKSDCSQ